MPQPIEPATEMLRVNVAERIQQIADRASLAAQMRTADDAVNDRVRIESQVQQSEAKSQEVEQELRRRNPFMGRRRRKNDDDAEQYTFYTAKEKQQVTDELEEHNLDISV